MRKTMLKNLCKRYFNLLGAFIYFSILLIVFSAAMVRGMGVDVSGAKNADTGPHRGDGTENPQAVSIHSIGSTGPAGGLIFYDKGRYSEGWRYLEAAPADLGKKYRWDNKQEIRTGINATGIGNGKANTAGIVSRYAAGSYSAIQCEDLVLADHDDWFLPSKDELDLMYRNLRQEGLGNFVSGWYWSSSEFDKYYARIQHFGTGKQDYDYKYSNYNVRAVRSF
jgi:hypothetical protein